MNKDDVFARTIWAGLESQDNYSNWFEDQVRRFSLVPHTDYEVFRSQPVNPQGGRPRLDHMLSQAAAVKIQAGNQKVANAISQKVGEMELQKHTKPNAVEAAHRALVQNQQVIEGLLETIYEKQEQLEYQQPMVTFSSRVQESSKLYRVGEMAKMMNIPGIGPTKMFKWLRQTHVLMEGNRHNQPYQEFIDAGYMEVKLADNNGHPNLVPMFTGKGLIWVMKRLVAGDLLIDDSEEIPECE